MNKIQATMLLERSHETLGQQGIIVTIHVWRDSCTLSMWKVEDNDSINLDTELIKLEYTNTLKLVSIGDLYTEQEAVIMFNKLRPWLEEELS